MMNFKEILFSFFPDKLIKEVKPFGNGHINSTFRLSFENELQEYILQKINTQVFKRPHDLTLNQLRLQKFMNGSHHDFEIPRLIATSSHQFLYQDSDLNLWRLMNYIEDSYSIEVVQNETQAYEAGKGFGWFAKTCSDLNPSDFHEVIKDFHRLSFRLNQLNEAIETDKAGRLKLVTDVVEFYKNREKSLFKIENLIDNHEIPLRIVHNDTKINNLLFRNNEAIAVIDLDTVGPGIIYYDYGDAIRTITNTEAEDERNTDLVHFDLSAFESFTKGYLLQTDSILNPKEKEFLYRAPIFMTYIMGIRFLTDYLNGDIYYKTSYSDHNLVRSLVQKKLIELMELNEDQMKTTINKYLS